MLLDENDCKVCILTFAKSNRCATNSKHALPTTPDKKPFKTESSFVTDVTTLL